MSAVMQKDFTPPATATSGLQGYDLEGTRAKKGRKPARGKPSEHQSQPVNTNEGQPAEWDCEDENGGTVACDHEDTNDHNDGASQDGSQDDELSAKRGKAKKTSPK